MGARLLIVIDTNVVSELMSPVPDRSVRRWSLSRASEIYLTSITLAEVGYGIERLPAGRRRDRLRADAAEIFAMFTKQVLPFDDAAAAEYPSVAVGRLRAGEPIGSLDAQIASICRVYDARLATRNVRDFAGTGVDVLNPWRGA